MMQTKHAQLYKCFKINQNRKPVLYQFNQDFQEVGVIFYRKAQEQW